MEQEPARVFRGTGIDPHKPALQAVGSGQRQRWRVPQLARLQLAERSRHQANPPPPYFKNDQAYVEQKNYTHVRGLLGYDRLGHPELPSELNKLLSLWSLWMNLYCVKMKQASCRREGSRQVRRHEKKSRSPVQRLLGSGQLSREHEKQIKDHLSAVNPFEMKAKIQQKEEAFLFKRSELMEQGSILFRRQRYSALQRTAACSIYEATGNNHILFGFWVARFACRPNTLSVID